MPGPPDMKMDYIEEFTTCKALIRIIAGAAILGY